MKKRTNFLRDNLHFSWSPALSYNKTWNCAIGERESGKSVDSWMTLFHAFVYEDRPSIVLRRRIADISEAYLSDTETLINKFLPPDKWIQLVFRKGQIKDGVIDVHIGEYGRQYSWQAADKLPVFFRCIGLSCPMNRIKSMVLPNVKWFFYDEMIANLRGGEKYLNDEKFLIQEIYTTYNREASTPIRILMAGNPYSVYNPIFTSLGVDTSKIKPGSFIVGDDYVIDCFQVPPELKELILERNPMYQFDDAYKRYAFGGEAVNDANIKVKRTEPRGYSLKYVFKAGNNYLAVHRRKDPSYGEDQYWVCMHNGDWYDRISARRIIWCYNFDDMVDGAHIADLETRKTTASIKDAMNKRSISYNCIDAAYLMEDIYPCL